MAPRYELTETEVRELLGELGRRLAAQGVQASIYVVGGAAIAMETDSRRVTADIDAVFHPAATVREEAAQLATDRGLPARWLDDSVAAFVPGGDAHAAPLDVEGVAVSVASPEHLLAMKMASFRPGRDQSDLDLLFDRLKITAPGQAADIALAVYGEYSVVLPDRKELELSARAVLDRRARGARRSRGHQGRRPRGTPSGGRFDTSPKGEPDISPD